MALEVPWFPHSLVDYVGDASEMCDRWRYVVVEEVIDRTALLQRWPWPLADKDGRLFWPTECHDSMRKAAISLSTLERRLYRPHHVHRRPRVGDTFAVLGADGPGWDSEEPVEELRELFPGLVLDVSAEAREAARLAYEGSLVPPVAEEWVDRAQVRRATAKRHRIRSRVLLGSTSSAQQQDRNGDTP